MCTQPFRLSSLPNPHLVSLYTFRHAVYRPSYAYALLTPISHPGCIKNPFVWLKAASACAGEAKVTENDFAPGFVPAGGRGVADVYPGYLLVSTSSRLLTGVMEKGRTVRIELP